MKIETNGTFDTDTLSDEVRQQLIAELTAKQPSSRFVPEKDELYCWAFYNSDGVVLASSKKWEGNSYDHSRFNDGNVFRTAAEAVALGKTWSSKAMYNCQVYLANHPELLVTPEQIADKNVKKYFLRWDWVNNQCLTAHWRTFQPIASPFDNFVSEDAAMQFAKDCATDLEIIRRAARRILI